VHGGPNAGSTWAPLAAEMQDFRCLLLDRTGCDLSEAVDITRYNLRAFGADLLAAVLDGLEIEEAAVVASSFGGALALFFAAAHPQRVTRMVQQGCPAFLQGMRVPMFMRMLSIGPLGRGIARQEATAKQSRDIMRQIGHAKSIDQGRLDDMVEWYVHLMNDTDTMQNEVQGIQHEVS